MVSSIQSGPISNRNQLLWDIIASASLVFVLCAFFEPRWETNDDVGMSMVAHGYGLAATASPNLIFSNVIWGYIVRLIPSINGVLGYSIATLIVLMAVGGVVLSTLQKLGCSWLISFSVLILLFTRPILFPQFTINAGLLSVGAIICWYLYAQHKSQWVLLVGCVLAFCGYLIRSHEFLLVLFIASPLLPWRKLLQDKSVKIAALLLLLAISTAAFIDYLSYQNDNWQAFNALNLARAPITDFGVAAQLKQQPEIISRYGYTQNDIDLISLWFFVDSEITNPKTLNAMFSDLGSSSIKNHAFANGWLGIKTFVNPILLPSLITAICLMLIHPSRRLLLAWSFCFVVFFMLGAFGRPGVLRVYIPILSLLVLAPFLTQHEIQGRIRWHTIAVIIFTTTFFNTLAVLSESRAAEAVSNQIRNELHNFPEDTVVLWGGVFPFESAYPVLKQSEVALSYQLYSLGVFTQAPFARSFIEQKIGNGMIDQLVSPNGVPVVTNKQRLDLLTIYCKERLGGVLHELTSHQYGQIRVSQLHCEKKIMP